MSSSSSICRSRSLPAYLKHETCEEEDLLLTRLPPSNYQVDDDDTDAINIIAQAAAGNNNNNNNLVAIKRDWLHWHPLILSTYLKENNKSDKCRFCEIYITWGCPVYKCIISWCEYKVYHKLCAELPRRITNLLHPEHPLGLEYFRSSIGKCLKCEEDISGFRYECVVCEDEFVLHVKCGLQDTPIICVKSTTTTTSSSSSSSSSSSLLSRCLSFPLDRKQNSSPIRFSDPRNLPNLKLLISSFSNFQFPKKAAQIRHFSHKKHPLILMTFFRQFISSFKQFQLYDCIICNAKILQDDLVYGCLECNFFLHKSCAEIVLPPSIRNTLHPAHLLELTLFFLQTNTTTATCTICDKDLSGGIGYKCKALCEYILGIECAFTHISEDHKEHKFTITKELIFTCDACGVTENKKHHSSVCTGCPLQVHQKCSATLFPPTVKQTRHPHTLHLTYFFECGDDFADRMCNICYNKINNVYYMYQCTKCTTYITHVTCSTSKDILENIEENEIEEKAIMPEDIEEGRQVKHFSHPDHDLIYTSKTTESSTHVVMICDACVRPISSCVPFYKCADHRCSFCLHKQCFELPPQLQHPLHAHRLSLISPRDEQYFTYKLFMVKCYGCDIRCNGFVYGCEECKFWMDVRCGLLTYTLKHDSHACTLSLVDYSRVRDQGIVDKAAKCSACDCKCKFHSLCKYTCEPCNFHLDLGCALLPGTVAHDCPKYNWKPNYPLKLRYGDIKNACGLYFCDMCEEPRGENDWFYRCEDCNWSNHPHCVLGKLQLKYRKLYQLNRQIGPFKLMKIAARMGYSCLKCKKPCKDSAFFCAEEQESYHVECASSERVEEKQDDKLRLAVRGFLNGIQEIRQSEEDNIRIVRGFLNEIWEIIKSKGDYNIGKAVEAFFNEIREIHSEGDDDTLDAVGAFFNEIREIQSEGDDDILGAVREFSNGFRVIMSKDLMALMKGDVDDDVRAFFNKFGEGDGGFLQSEGDGRFLWSDDEFLHRLLGII